MVNQTPSNSEVTMQSANTTGSDELMALGATVLSALNAIATPDTDRVAGVERQNSRLREELGLWLTLVNEGGVPRYTVTPGAALNTVVTSTKSLLGKAALSQPLGSQTKGS